MLRSIRQTALPARSRVPSYGLPPNSDFIPLHNNDDSDIEEDILYTIAAEPQEFIHNTSPTYVCPMHVEEGLYIVRQIRYQRLSQLAGVALNINETFQMHP